MTRKHPINDRIVRGEARNHPISEDELHTALEQFSDHIDNDHIQTMIDESPAVVETDTEIAAASESLITIMLEESGLNEHYHEVVRNTHDTHAKTLSDYNFPNLYPVVVSKQ